MYPFFEMGFGCTLGSIILLSQVLVVDVPAGDITVGCDSLIIPDSTPVGL